MGALRRFFVGGLVPTLLLENGSQGWYKLLAPVFLAPAALGFVIGVVGLEPPRRRPSSYVPLVLLLALLALLIVDFSFIAQLQGGGC